MLVPQEDEIFTQFQGFNMSVTDHDFSLLINAMIYFPSHPIEIFMNQKSLLAFRKHARPKNISALNISLFSKSVTEDPEVLYVISCLGKDVEFVNEQIKDLKIQPIIISNINGKNVTNIKNLKLHYNLLDREIRRRIVAYNQEKGGKEKVPDIRGKYKGKLDVPETGGGAVISNEIFLESLGFSFSGKASLPAARPETYRDFVENLFELTLNRIGPEGILNEVILFSPGIVPQFYDTKQHFWNQLLRDIEVKWHKDFIINGLIKNPHYSGFVINNFTFDNPANNPVVSAILQMRKRELLTTNLSISLLSAAIFASPVRLPNSINFHYKKLKQLEALSKRSDAKAPQLFQNKFKEINDVIRKEIGNGIIDLVLNKTRFCTICSDFPLEWIYFGKLPLMISHEVSKIPMTPGNMLLQYCAPGEGLDIASAAFEEILVIRSFSENDRLKTVLETAVKGYPISTRTKVKIIDVTSISEVIFNLNNFKGAMVVFDCHGNHEGPEGPGWLVIGEEKLNTWELAHNARIPPIVLLSACLTSAIGGSHASVSNGLLRSGALSVLGTFLPVDGVNSAIFMARVIYRLDAFLPAIKKMGKEMVSWRTLISTFFRMSYVTDFLNYFKYEKKILSREDYIKLHIDCNMKINSFQEDWFDDLLNNLSLATNITVSELIEMVQINNPLMETMLYCQHGRPELITIHF